MTIKSEQCKWVPKYVLQYALREDFPDYRDRIYLFAMIPQGISLKQSISWYSGRLNGTSNGITDAAAAEFADATDFGTVDEAAENRLRYIMKLFFYNACKSGKGTFCSFNIINFVVFFIQVMKVILITIQVFQFGKDRNHFNFIVSRGHTTLRHLLLKDWDASWETPVYPPAHGEFASYKTDDLYERIDEVVNKYHHIEDIALGYFTRLPSDKMIATMKLFHLDGYNGHQVDKEDEVLITEVTFPTHPGTFDFRKECERLNLTSPIRLLALTLKFSLHSVGIFEGRNDMLCLFSEGAFSFKNNENIGQVVIDLDTATKQIPCNRMNISTTDWDVQNVSEPLAKAVMVFCGMSLMVTVANASFGAYVCLLTRAFMKNNFRAYYKLEDEEERDLHCREYLSFFRHWDITSIIADSFILDSTFWLGSNKEHDYDARKMDVASFLLGVGTLLAWCSLLRFFNIHHRFGLLFKTINRAFLNVIAYLICAGLIFFGFVLCGYVMLGPYHVKFRSFSSTSETLAAIINGDEMYATLHMFEHRSETGAPDLIWYFTRFYLYSSISVFTFVVINLMMAIILGAYEAIQKQFEEEENLRDLVPLEKALYKFIETSKNSPFRNSIVQLMENDNSDCGEEEILRTHFRKFCRVTEDGRDIVRNKPRTITAFMEEGHDTKDCSRGCMKCSFLVCYQCHRVTRSQ